MTIETDVVIIGAGPCGLFQVFELGLLDIHAHVIETLPKPGGQCAELYPSKPIYDIPAYPTIGAQELIDRLMEQIAPFNPTFHFDQQVDVLERQEDGRFYIHTTANQQFLTRSVIVAGGVGSFAPVLLKIPGVEERVGGDVFYSIKDPTLHANKDIVILGGGDSALDWALDLQPQANSVVLIHRSDKFKAAPASVSRMRKLCDDYEMQFLTGNVTRLITSTSSANEPANTNLRAIEVTGGDGVARTVELDHLLVFFGLSPKLGPIANWGLDLKKNQIRVDTEKFESSEPGLYAVGDINWYPGKKKLILSGFHEAALAAFGIKQQLNPGQKVHLQYTTTSPVMHKRLGVDDPYSDETEAA
ncbi:NAD(P)/FAD-dependent oxidoreductase [Granulosicoccus sp.]|nr:NAD(P)/FAD-dependent oxidoreductase [Granulosicoccus sp.]MDB4222253.1 NAD(P)/FAD-dependent oxidoreductase [Granulosicoccus sp.]